METPTNNYSHGNMNVPTASKQHGMLSNTTKICKIHAKWDKPARERKPLPHNKIDYT
jgi:hypothetical protein